jgi:hypothetical protein
MKQPSRFREKSLVETSRLINFVALDNLTAQLPLIEVLRKKRRIRIWVSYDLPRECGTYIDAHFSGQVVCVTRYASGHTVEKINRPSDKELINASERGNTRLRKKPKPSLKNGRSAKAKRVHGRTQHART